MILEQIIVKSENLMNSYTVSDDLQAVWLKNYKVASSSIVTALKDKGFKSLKSVYKADDVNFNPMDYWVFMFVRNPYDRFISCYLHFQQHSHEQFKGTIYEFIEHFGEHSFWGRHLSPQAELYKLMPVDFVGKFENINEDWKVVMDKLNVPELPHLNTSNRKVSYINYYTPELLDKITELYKEDFELFNYPTECL